MRSPVVFEINFRRNHAGDRVILLDKRADAFLTLSLAAGGPGKHEMLFSDQLSAAHEENHDHRASPSEGKPDVILIDIPIEHDKLLFGDTSNRGGLVAKVGGSLEIQFLAGIGHFFVETLGKLLAVAAKEHLYIFHNFKIFLRIGLPDARREASSDLMLKARAFAGLLRSQGHSRIGKVSWIISSARRTVSAENGP